MALVYLCEQLNGRTLASSVRENSKNFKKSCFLDFEKKT